MKKMKNENKEKLKRSEPSEKVKRFPKFGILDVAIILLIVSIAIGIAFRYNFFNALSHLQKLDECAISFSVKNIENTTQHYIGIGDTVYFSNNGKVLGTIMESSDASKMSLTTTPAAQTFFIDNGSAITVNYPLNTRIDATGRIKCEGKFSSDGTFLLNGNDYMSAGQTYIICTEKATLEILILDINIIENS